MAPRRRDVYSDLWYQGGKGGRGLQHGDRIRDVFQDGVVFGFLRNRARGIPHRLVELHADGTLRGYSRLTLMDRAHRPREKQCLPDRIKREDPVDLAPGYVFAQYLRVTLDVSGWNAKLG